MAKKSKKSKKKQRKTPPTPKNPVENLTITGTGEIFQPVRIHYQVGDREKLVTSMQKLECMSYDDTQKRWVWLYAEETQKLSFHRQPTEPVVLGELFFIEKSELILNLRSCERAIMAIEFFDRYIPRSIFQATHITIVNKLFSGSQAKNKTRLNEYFPEASITTQDTEAINRNLMELTENVKDPEQRKVIAMEYILKLAQQPEPEIEKLPLNYYEEGISSLQFCLNIRQLAAFRQWEGNKNYKKRDAISELLKS